MYLTEKEIFTQYDALEKTFAEIMNSKKELQALYESKEFKSIVFIGCGSSYSLAKSAALVARLYMGIPGYAYTAGDLLINFDRFRPALEDALLVSLSRSGSTSEVVLLVTEAKEKLGNSYISIAAREDAPLADLADVALEIPWAFDESVCQTRTVTNLYLASTMVCGLLGKRQELLDDLEKAIEFGNDGYMERYKQSAKEIAKKEWNNVVVLADGELEGIAEEGALALTEISLLPTHYYHLLDVRHGPMVLINENTLVVAMLSPGTSQYQKDLLEDMKAKNVTLVVLGTEQQQYDDADLFVTLPELEHFTAQGIPFIYLPQVIALYKALEQGINPDEPEGLDAWIEL